MNPLVKAWLCCPRAAFRTLPHAAGMPVVLLALTLTLSGPLDSAFSKTTFVWPDEASPDSLISRAALASDDGDTIAIMPGLYYDHIHIVNKSLTLRGIGSTHDVVVDGSRVYPGHPGSIVHAEASTPNKVITIHNITFRGGLGSEVYSTVFGGGALFQDIAEVYLKGVRFVDNSASDRYGRGGGMALLGASYGQIDSCLFLDNQARTFGGMMYCDACDSIDVLRCRFELSEQSTSYDSAFIYCRGVGQILLMDTDVSSSNLLMDTVGCRFLGTGLVIRDSRFRDQVLRSATSLQCQIGEGSNLIGEALIERCVFHAEGQEYSATHGLRLFLDGPVRVVSSTFFGIPVSLFSERSLSLERSIFANGHIEIGVSGPSQVGCLAIWGDSLSVLSISDPIDVVHIVDSNPLFCPGANEAFLIADESPCAAQNSPNGCGLIGIGNVGCSLTPIERDHWGGLKTRFRR